MRESTLSIHKLQYFCVIGSYFIYNLQEKIYLGKKKKASLLNSFQDWLSNLIFMLATFLLLFSLLLIFFFNFPLKILICMIGLSSLKQISLVFDFYLILSSVFFFN